jgi:hypothetical protein
LIEPASVQISFLDFFAIQKLKQKRLVTGPAFDDDHAPAQSPTKSRQGFFPGLPMGNDLRDHRIEL